MKKAYVIVLGIILITLSLVTIFYNQNDKDEIEKEEFSYTPLLYKICDYDSCIHLLGSIHVGDDRVTKFNDAIIDIYEKSEYLAVEVDTTNISISEDMFLLHDETIDDLVNDETKSKLEDFASKHLFFPYDSLKIFSLGYIQNYLSLLPAIELGLLSSGVDDYFLKLASRDNKEIISIETYESQLAFFTDYSNEFYIRQIEYAIDNYEQEKELMKELYETYLTGDKEKIETILSMEEDIESTEEEERYTQAMIYDRNILMTSNVQKFLEENQNVFMIVGTAHVLGDGGIIDLLKDKDYEISIVK